MTGADTAGPRGGKTIREKTSLLPGSCASPGHLDAVGVSLTCRPPATGNGSVPSRSSTSSGIKAASCLQSIITTYDQRDDTCDKLATHIAQRLSPILKHLLQN